MRRVMKQVSPGTLATIFGQNLSDVSGVVLAGGNPLPTQLAGVRVLVNGIPAAIFSIAYANGEDQISFQVPFEVATGPNAAEVQVLLHNFQVADVFTDSFTEDPGIFMYQGNYAVAVLASNYSLIGPDNPALPGDVIILYATGLGPVPLNVPDGYAAPYDPLAYTADPSQVLIDGEPCTIYFSGLAPGFVGLYQINLRVPYDARRGNLDIQIQTPYASSALAKLPVD
jgi:minor extracellular serine protease Vpr